MSAEELERGKLLDRLNSIAGGEPDPDDDARTICGWADYLKSDRNLLGRKIKEAVRLGEMEEVTRRRRMTDGRIRSEKCYRFVD